jgi:hypothetical protein
MHKLNVYNNTFSRQIDLSPTIFVEKTCVRLLDALQGPQAEDSLTHLQQHIATFDALHDDVLSLEAELALWGVSAEMTILHDIMGRIEHIIFCLEELWCLGSQGYAVLEVVYRKNQMLYQS